MKFLRFVLCIALVSGSLTGVCAAGDNDMESALAQVKQRFDTDSYEEFTSDYSKDSYGNEEYSFYWSNNSGKYDSMYVSYADGIITGYNKYDNVYEESASVFSLEIDEALEIANNFLKKVNPQIADKIVVKADEDSQSILSNSYFFNIYRTENSIPVIGDHGNITVSAKEKEVTGFYINYSQGIGFKTCDNVIDSESAKEAYKTVLMPQLKYDFSRDYQKGTISAYLKYASLNSGGAVNAYDGSFFLIDNDYAVWESGYGMSEKSASTDMAMEGFSPSEVKELTKIQGLLTQDQAIKLIQKNQYIKYDSSFVLDSVALTRDRFNQNKYYYNFNFSKGETEFLRVVLDAKNGAVIEFYKNGEYKEGKQDVQKEIKLAEKAVKALAPDKAAEFVPDEGQYEGCISFTRYKNGVEVLGNIILVSFDYKDNVVGFSINCTEDVDFAPIGGAIPAEKAAECAFEKIGFELAYAVDRESKTAQPVYAVLKNASTEAYEINAFTGQLINYNGEDVVEKGKMVYTDIEGHYGQRAFERLAQFGIGFSGGELKPDEKITQAEFLSLLQRSFSYGEDDIEETYGNLIACGIFEPEKRNDSAPVTREEAAVYIVREMGAEAYAKFDDIYVAPFDDVVTNKGYIALLKAMKVVNGDGSGFFYPQKEITRGDALVMIYNYFNK